VLKPDAILEFPGAARRLFIEAETGAHSIATADPLKYGATLRKLERYVRFVTGIVPGAGLATFYENAFRDAWKPELIFLVHSGGRKAKVEGAIRAWSRGRGLDEFAVRVLTFGEAPAALVTALDGRAEAARPQRLVTIDHHKARLLREGFNAAVEALNGFRKAVAEHNTTCDRRIALPPVPLSELNGLRDLITHDLLGDPRIPDGDGA
jgi:glyoxylate carboligase